MRLVKVKWDSLECCKSPENLNSGWDGNYHGGSSEIGPGVYVEAYSEHVVGPDDEAEDPN